MNESLQLKTPLSRKLFFFHFFSTLFLLTLISGSLLSKNWVHSTHLKKIKLPEKSSEKIDLSLFSGSLESCISGCKDLRSYFELKSVFCESREKRRTSEQKSLCKMFTNLFISGQIKKISDVLTLISLIFLMTLQIISFKYVKWLKCWLVLLVCSFITCCLGTFAWFSLNSLKIRNCSGFPDNGSRPELCMSLATFLDLGAFIGFCFYLVGFFMFFRKISKKYDVIQPVFTNLSYQVEISPKVISLESHAVVKKDDSGQFLGWNQLKNSYDETRSLKESEIQVLSASESKDFIEGDESNGEKVKCFDKERLEDGLRHVIDDDFSRNEKNSS